MKYVFSIIEGKTKKANLDLHVTERHFSTCSVLTEAFILQPSAQQHSHHGHML